jgi:hypothetical protein
MKIGLCRDQIFQCDDRNQLRLPFLLHYPNQGSAACCALPVIVSILKNRDRACGFTGIGQVSPFSSWLERSIRKGPSQEVGIPHEISLQER